jgi:hypothetical protein
VKFDKEDLMSTKSFAKQVILGVLCFLILYSFPSFASEGGGEELGNTLPIWSVLAFVMLLLSIALLPLFLGHWWENNKNKGIIAFILALPVAIFFLVKDYHYLTHTGLEHLLFCWVLYSRFPAELCLQEIYAPHRLSILYF